MKVGEGKEQQVRIEGIKRDFVSVISLLIIYYILVEILCIFRKISYLLCYQVIIYQGGGFFLFGMKDQIMESSLIIQYTVRFRVNVSIVYSKVWGEC